MRVNWGQSLQQGHPKKSTAGNKWLRSHHNQLIYSEAAATLTRRVAGSFCPILALPISHSEPLDLHLHRCTSPCLMQRFLAFLPDGESASEAVIGDDLESLLIMPADELWAIAKADSSLLVLVASFLRYARYN